MQPNQKNNTVSLEEISAKLAELNKVYTDCQERCGKVCKPAIRARYMPLRIWFEERSIPIVLKQGQYVIETGQ